MARLEKGRSNFRIDRRFRGIGRIKKSSGTSDRAVYRRMLVMLDELYEMPKWEILKDIQSGVVSPLEVYNSYKTHKLENVSSAATVKLLNPTLFEWANGHDVAESTRAAYAETFRAMLRCAPVDGKVNDLPGVLGRFRKVCAQRQTHRTFNMCRSAVQAYLRTTLRRSHRLWVDVADIPPFDTKARKRPGNPQTVAQMLELMTRLSPKFRQVAWSIFTTGMGTKEYLGPWEASGGGLHIGGTKREMRNRVIPLVGYPIRHHIHSRSFAQVLQRASGGKVQPYDIRRSFAKLMEDAGITRTRRRIYMGHKIGDVTEIYERHEVDQYLGSDAKILQEFIARETEAASNSTHQVMRHQNEIDA